MRTIKILDTTLRDGEQTPGVSFTPEEKLKIAISLDEFGVDVIEAGSAITSPGEQESIRRIANEGLRAEISSYSRILKSDIDVTMKCDVDSIFLVTPTSRLHIKYKLGTTQGELLEKTLDCIDYCKDHGLIVDLCAEDGTRTEPEFLLRLMKEATEHKIDRYTIADTVGTAIPERIHEIFSILGKEAKIPLGVHCHDDLGMATANTVVAVNAGVSMVNVTVNGIGERAGNAPLEEVIMALKEGYGYNFRIKTEEILKLSKMVEKLCRIPVAPNKAIVGGNAFTHEAGIHVDGILKRSETYEAIKPESVGARRRFVLGKHVGTKSVRKMLEDDGIKANEQELREILKHIKYMGDKGKRVTNVDLQAIANSVRGVKIKRAIELDELVAVAGNKFTPIASVKLKIKDREVMESSTGTGPVDAAIKAIEHATRDLPFELTEYHVDSISGGTDAVVQVMVELKSKDRVITAQGAGTDIILASVNALVNGINLITGK